MPRIKKVVEEAVVTPKESKGSVTVVWGNGSRVYSKEVHGADFKDLADEFVSKNERIGAKIV